MRRQVWTPSESTSVEFWGRYAYHAHEPILELNPYFRPHPCLHALFTFKGHGFLGICPGTFWGFPLLFSGFSVIFPLFPEMLGRSGGCRSVYRTGGS